MPELLRMCFLGEGKIGKEEIVYCVYCVCCVSWVCRVNAINPTNTKNATNHLSMLNMFSIGKTLILFGMVLVALGAIFMLGGKIPWLGRLPGDIYVQRENFSLFFPITTSIIISIILSVIIALLRRR